MSKPKKPHRSRRGAPADEPFAPAPTLEQWQRACDVMDELRDASALWDTRAFVATARSFAPGLGAHLLPALADAMRRGERIDAGREIENLAQSLIDDKAGNRRGYAKAYGAGRQKRLREWLKTKAIPAVVIVRALSPLLDKTRSDRFPATRRARLRDANAALAKVQAPPLSDVAAERLTDCPFATRADVIDVAGVAVGISPDFVGRIVRDYPKFRHAMNYLDSAAAQRAFVRTVRTAAHHHRFGRVRLALLRADRRKARGTVRR